MDIGKMALLATALSGLLIASSFSGATVAFAAVETAEPTDTVQQLPEKYKDRGICVIDEPGKAVGDSTFFELPESAKGALIIAPEVAKDLGLKGGKVSKADEARVFDAATKSKGKTSEPISPQLQSASGWTNFWAPLGGGWSPVIRRTTVHNHVSEKYYSWYVASTASGTACGSGSGYYTGYNGGTFGFWKGWYGLGCGTSSTVRVPWENVMAYPEFQARAVQVYWGVPGSWI